MREGERGHKERGWEGKGHTTQVCTCTCICSTLKSSLEINVHVHD